MSRAGERWRARARIGGRTFLARVRSIFLGKGDDVDGTRAARSVREAELAHAAGELKGGVAKAAQLLGYLVVDPVREKTELAKLFSAVPAVPADAVREVVREDLGKSRDEGWLTEINFLATEAAHVIEHLPAWAKPERVPTPLMLRPGHCKVYREPLGLALIIAPLASELPEKFNSIIWVSQGKDTLAMGNISGAMVFQSCIPVAIGVAFTEWELSETALVSAIIALVSTGIVYVSIKQRGYLSSYILARAGLLWVGFVIYVVAKLIIEGSSETAAH